MHHDLYMMLVMVFVTMISSIAVQKNKMWILVVTMMKTCLKLLGDTMR
jgi:hypothetical protein